MAITVRSAKDKGRRFQQWVRDRILSLWPQLSEDDVRSVAMGSQGEDIQLSSAARKALGGYQIECKARAKVAIYDWLSQAKTHGKHEPLLFVKADRKPPLAVVDADHFLTLLAERQNIKEAA